MQCTIRDGRRCGTATAYLRPALARPNLRVEVGALVTRVVIEGTRAVGVEFVRDGATQVVRAEREVLLAGGVINSPQVLMLSGIGDPEELRAHGIDVRVALPGVGRNLQDHVMAPVAYRRRTPGPFARNMRLDRIGTHVLNAHFRGKGFATELPAPLTAFLKTDSSARDAGPAVALPRRAAAREAVSAAVPRRVRRRLRRARGGAASGKPRPRAARVRRSRGGGAHPPELPFGREGLAHAARGPAAAARPRPAARDDAVRRSRTRAGAGEAERRGTRRAHPRHRHHRASPARHLPHGRGRRRDGGGRRPICACAAWRTCG